MSLNEYLSRQFPVSGFRNPAHLALDVLGRRLRTRPLVYGIILAAKLVAAVLYLDKGTRMVSNPADMEFFVFL